MRWDSETWVLLRVALAQADRYTVPDRYQATAGPRTGLFKTVHALWLHMAPNDVWIVGAGASVESNGPSIANFREASTQVMAKSVGKHREMLDTALRFWDEKLRSFNIEEFFGFVDSGLGDVTGEGDLTELRSKILFLIAKVITERLHGPVSEQHLQFVGRLDNWTPIITLNWDALLDNAIVETQRRRVSYVFPKQPDYDPKGRGSSSQKLLKLHGSLNWLYCEDCKLVSVLDQKESAIEFLAGDRSSLSCHSCHISTSAEILMVPPVLGKLHRASATMSAIWDDAYKVLRDAHRVFVIGYSFPPSDLQTRLFISRALSAAANLRLVKVITKPKFGTRAAQFEDRYADMLRGSGQVDLLEFEYISFGRYVASSTFARDVAVSA